MFQKRHYNAIADALHRAKDSPLPEVSLALANAMTGFTNRQRAFIHWAATGKTWDAIVEDLVSAFEVDNPNFGPDRFRLACREGLNAKACSAKRPRRTRAAGGYGTW